MASLAVASLEPVYPGQSLPGQSVKEEKPRRPAGHLGHTTVRYSTENWVQYSLVQYSIVVEGGHISLKRANISFIL